MTSTNWRNGLGVGLAAVGVMLGSAAIAPADPAAPTTPAPVTSAPTASTPKATVAVDGGAAAGASAAQSAASAPVSGDVLDQLADEYAVGSGGGQLSNLLKTVLKLRSMGFKPSKANLAEIQTAMTYRPNQNPLINALKDTIAYQAKLKGQLEILQQAQSGQNANSAVMGAGQMPGASNPAQLPVGPVAQVPTDAVPVTP